MQGVLALAVELWTFGSPDGLQVLTFSKCWASPPHLAKVGLRQLKRFRWRLQLCFKHHFNQRSSHKVMGSKVVGVPTLGISRLPPRSPETKRHLGVVLIARHKVYSKGEGNGFPQVRVVVSLVSPYLLVVRLCTKNVRVTYNQLVVWFVQVHVSNWLFVNLPSPDLGVPACPSTPEVLWTKEHAPTPSSFITFTFGLEVESIKNLRGVSLLV